MDIFLIRHGQTQSNRDLRYLGRTDEPLSKEGAARVKEAGCFSDVPCIGVSPMLRARETASLLFPNAVQRVYADLRETDFGDFEMQPVSKLKDDPAYQAWIAANCETTCPNGEDPALFAARCKRGFLSALADARAQDESRLILVLHGGVIMHLMHAYADPEIPFFNWFIGNCACFYAELNEAEFAASHRFSRYFRPEKLAF